MYVKCVKAHPYFPLVYWIFKLLVLPGQRILDTIYESLWYQVNSKTFYYHNNQNVNTVQKK